MSGFSQQTFKNVLNAAFRLDSEKKERVELKLIKVSDIKDQGPFEAFSIIFSGPKNKFLKQNQYNLTNSVLGTNSIFIVPIAEKDNAFEYEAVFSYKKKVE